MSNYKELLTEFIVDNFLFGDREKLSIDTPLFEKGVIDSTGVLELVAFIEENFSVKVTDEELIQSNFSDISAIDRFIHSKSNHSSS